MKTVTYTKDDYYKPITSGIAKYLPVTLPKVELKRGQYEFEVEGTKYKIEKHESSKTLHNSIGATYQAPSSYYTISLVEGKSNYGIIGDYKRQYETKSKLVDDVNYRIKHSVYANVKPEDKPETWSQDDLKESFEALSDADKIKALQHQIDSMALICKNGFEAKNKAFAQVFGCEPCEGKYISNKRRIKITPIS